MRRVAHLWATELVISESRALRNHTLEYCLEENEGQKKLRPKYGGLLPVSPEPDLTICLRWYQAPAADEAAAGAAALPAVWGTACSLLPLHSLSSAPLCHVLQAACKQMHLVDPTRCPELCWCAISFLEEFSWCFVGRAS